MDALASLLYEVRSDGALFSRNVLAPPWSVRFADRTPLTLLTMLRGSGWILPGDGDGDGDGDGPVALAEGDVAVVVGPEPFTIADEPDPAARPLYVRHGPDHCTTADGEEVRDDVILGLRTCGNTADGPHVLLTGSYQVGGSVSERLLSALPRVLVVRHDGEPGPILDLTALEVGRDDPGQQAVLDRLLDLLLLATLREWFACPESDPPGWYRALGDPVAGKALRLMHDRPARPWTVAALAEEAGVSRATFARRFGELVGRPPMAYLAGWRLALAADLLARTDATVESIARQVGYRSAFGLSVAFQRVHGTRPSEHRAAVRQGRQYTSR
ncbi:AraC family transcriptional regulator [Streptomyces sp. DK15]|uniref:AraC family transcriptional regulator n=1 Tax=Streptomyces sp. DK15 TaxID=2957499 RepID=UPI0029B604E7|nr:AraC family transcriptional regulator [Streptomyces sp. DK15]MDX2393656.1 AraC family transcriptional regulator [Streptomyces sp. DK15]